MLSNSTTTSLYYPNRVVRPQIALREMLGVGSRVGRVFPLRCLERNTEPYRGYYEG